MVVAASREAAFASKSGGGGGPFGAAPRDRFAFGAPVRESSEVVESFPGASFNLSIAVEGRGLVESKPMDGRMRRFCLLGGSISSRSTGTPRDTRKRRRMRERVQLGGCIGGGETSCCQSDKERSERKGCGRSGAPVEGGESTGLELGRIALMYGLMASVISSAERSVRSSCG